MATAAAAAVHDVKFWRPQEAEQLTHKPCNRWAKGPARGAPNGGYCLLVSAHSLFALPPFWRIDFTLVVVVLLLFFDDVVGVVQRRRS